MFWVLVPQIEEQRPTGLFLKPMGHSRYGSCHQGHLVGGFYLPLVWGLFSYSWPASMQAANTVCSHCRRLDPSALALQLGWTASFWNGEREQTFLFLEFLLSSVSSQWWIYLRNYFDFTNKFTCVNLQINLLTNKFTKLKSCNTQFT